MSVREGYTELHLGGENMLRVEDIERGEGCGRGHLRFIVVYTVNLKSSTVHLASGKGVK